MCDAKTKTLWIKTEYCRLISICSASCAIGPSGVAPSRILLVAYTVGDGEDLRPLAEILGNPDMETLAISICSI